MPILKYHCPQELICNSSTCEHKKDHEYNETFCNAGCKWSKDTRCQSDLKGYIDGVLCDVAFRLEKPFSDMGVSQSEALDLIMAAIKEEYEG